MQTPPQPPAATLAQYAIYVIATSALFGAGSVATIVIKWLLNRSKIRPEIDAISAGAEKSRAEVRASDGNLLKDAWERIDQQAETIDELRAQLLISRDEEHRLARVIEDKDLKIKLQENQLNLRISVNPQLPPYSE